MTDAQAPSELRWDPPGPGNWNNDPVHFPRPVTRYWSEMHPEPFLRGTRDFMAYYGSLLDGLESRYVNGFAYNQMKPVDESEIPQRFARADEVFPQKVWRGAAEGVGREGQAGRDGAAPRDPGRRSRRALRRRAGRLPPALCRAPRGDDHAAHALHGQRHRPDRRLPRARRPVDRKVTRRAARPHRGAAPVSAGSSDEQEALIAAIGNDPAAQELLASDDDPAAVFAALRELPGDTGAAVNGYLDLVGYRPLDGFDISEAGALEMPDALLRAIRRAASGEGRAESDVEASTADIRSEVPEEHQAEFDDLLGEARLMYRLRDERGVYSDAWASGLMRRAALSAGRRVAERGRIQEPDHMVDASLDEMCALVTDSGGPSAEELAARAQYRATHTAKDAPPFLGDPPQPPPDPSGLPPGEARVMTAVGIAMGSLFGSSEEEHTEDTLRGLAASQGVYEGPARLIAGPSEFDRIQQGDILVTPATTEAFNILLPLLGAIVTDSGGLLSHSAIVAREYGIPGVVGTREATDRIADGARLRVDGTAGEVTLL